MKIGLRFFLFVLLFSAACSTTKIACLGDSITQGRVASESKEQLSSYRYPLWYLLDSAGFRFSLVGSNSLLFKEDNIHKAVYPSSALTGHKFEPFHEGHWGWTTGNVLDSLDYWLANYKPDIVLIHLGDNDVSAKIDSVGIAQNLKSIIYILRMKNPNVRILIAKLITGWCTQVNRAVPLIAAKLSTDKSPVIVVDMETGFINDPKMPGSMTVDWVHPNAKGARWMAERWFASLCQYLKK